MEEMTKSQNQERSRQGHVAFEVPIPQVSILRDANVHIAYCPNFEQMGSIHEVVRAFDLSLVLRELSYCLTNSLKNDAHWDMIFEL